MFSQTVNPITKPATRGCCSSKSVAFQNSNIKNLHLFFFGVDTKCLTKSNQLKKEKKKQCGRTNNLLHSEHRLFKTRCINWTMEFKPEMLKVAKNKAVENTRHSPHFTRAFSSHEQTYKLMSCSLTTKMRNTFNSYRTLNNHTYRKKIFSSNSTRNLSECATFKCESAGQQ